MKGINEECLVKIQGQSIRRGIGQWRAGRFLTPRTMRMDLDDGTVQDYGFDLHADDLRVLQLRKYAIQHPALRSTIPASIDGVSVTEPLWQTALFATPLGNVQDGGWNVQIVERHVAA